MSDEYKDRYIIITLLKTPPRYYRQYKKHHGEFSSSNINSLARGSQMMFANDGSMSGRKNKNKNDFVITVFRRNFKD